VIAVANIPGDSRCEYTRSFRRRFYEPAGVADGTNPDLIFLTGYDVHENTNLLDYLGDGVDRTFPDAMRAVGHHAILIDSPMADGANCGLFAKASVFGLPELTSLTHDGHTAHQIPAKLTTQCGTSSDAAVAVAAAAQHAAP